MNLVFTIFRLFSGASLFFDTSKSFYFHFIQKYTSLFKEYLLIISLQIRINLCKAKVSFLIETAGMRID